MDLKNKLSIAKGLSNDNDVSESRVKSSVPKVFGDNMIDTITEQVFGNKLISDGNGNEPYDANAELKMINAGIPKDKLAISKLPNVIKESIANNPLIVTSVDPNMDAFTAKLAAVQGVQKASNIINQLEEEDQAKENAKKTAMNEIKQRSSIDYELIKTIVENAIGSLKNELMYELTESANHANSNENSTLKVMKFGEKFLFLDSDDNVYECKMVYRGKNKKKTK